MRTPNMGTAAVLALAAAGVISAVDGVPNGLQNYFGLLAWVLFIYGAVLGGFFIWRRYIER